jgi:hypothetical protein
MCTKILCCGLMVLGLVCPLMATAYVNALATGANNGTSWANAWTNLDAALTAVPASTELHVASGTYKPAALTGFTPTNLSVTLMGGYNAASPSDAVRDPDAYPTILSGDINGDDTDVDLLADPCGLYVAAISGARMDNARCLNLDAKSGTVVDGFILRNGKAAGGGAATCSLNLNTQTVVFRNCLFTQNFSTGSGGCLSSNRGILTVTDCDFVQNSTWSAGSIVNVSTTGTPLAATSALAMKNCLVDIATCLDASGSINMRGKTAGSISNCVISRCNNFGVSSGGGAIEYNLSMDQNGTLTVSNTLIQGCRSWQHAAGIYIFGRPLEELTVTANITNVVIANCGPQNSPTGPSDIAFYAGAYNPVCHVIANLTNCTIANNHARSESAIGGWVSSDTLLTNEATINLKNCIAWGNYGDGGNSQMTHNPAAGSQGRVFINESYVCIDTADPNTYVNPAADHMIYTNPQFDSAFFLAATSTSRNAGNNAYVPTDTLDVDNDGNVAETNPWDLSLRNRFNGTVDLGAYEYWLPADIDASAKVNLIDFELLATAWLDNNCGILNRWCGNTDTNHSGAIDMADFNNLATEWLQ